MKRLLLLALLALGAVSLSAAAAEAGPKLRTPHYTFDRASIRKGAEIFASRCSACHSVSRIRYQRLETDLDMTPATIKKDIMFGSGAELHSAMVSAMLPQDGKKWFGLTPPDLTLAARYRGLKWVYSYLTGFYRDSKRPTGWSNHYFKNAAMPNVFEPLQGIVAANGTVIKKGSMSPQQFKQYVGDIIAWLRYTSDPSKISRETMGPWVIAFLVVFTLLAYALKRVVWRKVH